MIRSADKPGLSINSPNFFLLMYFFQPRLVQIGQVLSEPANSVWVLQPCPEQKQQQQIIEK